MTRVGFKLKVKREKLAEYREAHRNVWPEMQEALRRAGWHNYSLFLDEEGNLFGYLETPGTFREAQEAMERTDVNDRWQREMAPYFESRGGEHADRTMAPLEEVFHLD